MSSNSGATAGDFMTQQQPGQWLASRLIGTTVVGANNESIGDVNDVLMDRSGQTVAVVVGVGGFLGIGEKNVAVPFKSLEFTARPPATAGSAGTTGGAGTSMGAGGTAAGGTAGTATTGTAGAGSAAGNDMPDRITLRMSKQDLQNAPQFMRTGAGTSASGTGGGSTATGGSTGTGAGGTGTGAAGTGASGTAPRQ